MKAAKTRYAVDKTFQLVSEKQIKQNIV